jgi:UDP-N-acetylmuramoylalanine--D-glutamate ligase
MDTFENTDLEFYETYTTLQQMLEDKMKDWNGQNVIVIGAARQGTALAQYLVENGANVVINDMRSANQLIDVKQTLSGLDIEWVLGGHPLNLLNRADIICVSGGVPLTIPLVVEARRRRIPITNDSQIFLEICPCPVIGITGSAGKTTTTSLVGLIADISSRIPVADYAPGFSGGGFDLPLLQKPPDNVWVGGNIGTPLISVVNQIRPGDIAVMELSSFQLEIMTKSPQISAILNITPNHLDRHVTMNAYKAAKARILEHQKTADIAVLGRDDHGAWSLTGKVRGSVVTFGIDRPPVGLRGAFIRDERIYLWNGVSDVEVIDCDSVHLRGEHNLLNVLASCSICASAGLPVKAMRSGISMFQGVPHRLEYIRTWNGSDWYNDSIATAPERAMAAINSFDEPIILLAGGRDKSLPWKEFAKLVRQCVDHLVVFGEVAEKISTEIGTLSKESRPYSLTRCAGLEEAVYAAKRVVQPGYVVLLSPGGTSFDEFRDFEERGEAFKKWVQELK